LLSHQKAAYEILLELYTPATVTSHATSIAILKWYNHFDVYVAMLSGTPSLIKREWHEALHKHYVNQYEQDTENISLLYEESLGSVRILAHDMFALFNKMNSGQLTDAEFRVESERISSQLHNWEHNFPIRFMEPENLITHFPDAPTDSADPSDPYKPKYIFGGDNFPTNQFRLSLLGLRNMFETRMAAYRGQPKPEKLSKELANMIFGMVNAVRFWNEAPRGTLLLMRSVFSLAIFLSIPTRAKDILWARETFAAIEAQG
jgi:hypothetical protein